MTESRKNECCSESIPSNHYISIDKDRCNGCGLCTDICPFGLPIQTQSGKCEINRPDLCVECSACQRNCPTGAIIMQEQEGCGCLWDARSRAKGSKNKSSKCC